MLQLTEADSRSETVRVHARKTPGALATDATASSARLIQCLREHTACIGGSGNMSLIIHAFPFSAHMYTFYT